MAYVRFIYSGTVKGITVDDIKSKLTGIDLAHVKVTGTNLELIARENKDLDKAAAEARGTELATEIKSKVPEITELSLFSTDSSADVARLNAEGGRKRRKFRKSRKMSKKYCKKTPCRRMGFTQKASCRPYKNCYTRRR
jgi:hypothetical protein